MSEAIHSDDFAFALQAAQTLAANGDKRDATIAVLAKGLDGEYSGAEIKKFGPVTAAWTLPHLITDTFNGPGEERERHVLRQMWRQYDSVRALSRIGATPRVVDLLIETAKAFDRMQLISGSAIFALGAIGAKGSVEFLTYQANDKARPEAVAALDLFGKATFEDIQRAELCPKCGHYSPMEKEKGFFGEKKRCKACGQTHKEKK